MKLIPDAVSRLSHRSVLKLSASSPTILVVTGVVGLGATAIMAARATRRIDPVVEGYQKQRAVIDETVYATRRGEQRAILDLYVRTAAEYTKLYGPTIVVGVLSAGSILHGHKILHGRHAATMAAYSGLMDQFQSYRSRVARTLGAKAEKDIYDGAHGEWVEDPDHKGEYKLQPKYDESLQDSDHYLRPWFDESSTNFLRNGPANYGFLKGAQAHANRVLEIRGHVFLNDIFDQLGMPRTQEGQVAGWLRDDKGGKDGFIDFGFMTDNHPHTVAFRNGAEQTVRLNFNIDGVIWNKI